MIVGQTFGGPKHSIALVLESLQVLLPNEVSLNIAYLILSGSAVVVVAAERLP